jgi:hypothetical protein
MMRWQEECRLLYFSSSSASFYYSTTTTTTKIHSSLLLLFISQRSRSSQLPLVALSALRSFLLSGTCAR